MRTDHPTLTAVVGANIKRLRDGQGFTQDEAASLLRSSGLDVSRSALAAIERGSGRTLDLGELALVCIAFDVEISDLLAGKGRVRVSDSATVTLNGIRRVLTGQSASLRRADVDSPVTRSLDKFSTLKRQYERLWPGARPAQIVTAERASRGEAESKAAKRLDVSPTTLSVAAFGKWGRSLTDERDARLAATPGETEGRTLQALRGHVTRELLDELRSVLDKEDTQ